MVLRPEDSLRDATARLRSDPWGVAVVLDADGRFASTVTDIALRRALLRHVAQDAPVSEVMSARPVFADATAGEEQIVELLQTHRLRALPIVDEAGNVVAIRALDEFPAHAVTPVAVIMAGGRGLRLRPVTDKVPKPLLRVGSRVDHRADHRAASSPPASRDIYLALNYKAKMFERAPRRRRAPGRPPALPARGSRSSAPPARSALLPERPRARCSSPTPTSSRRLHYGRTGRLPPATTAGAPRSRRRARRPRSLRRVLRTADARTCCRPGGEARRQRARERRDVRARARGWHR